MFFIARTPNFSERGANVGNGVAVAVETIFAPRALPPLNALTQPTLADCELPQARIDVACIAMRTRDGKRGGADPAAGLVPFGLVLFIVAIMSVSVVAAIRHI